MNTTRILTLLLALLFGLGLNTSATAEDSAGPTVTTKLFINDSYQAFGAGITLWNDTCLQAEIGVAFNNGVYLFLWGSSDLEGRPGSSLGDEYDFGVGWGGKLGDWNVDIGVTYFDEPHLGRVARFGPEDILYTHIKVGRDIGKGWTASAGFENYSTTHNTGYNGGNLASLEVAKTFKLTKKWSMPFSVAAVWDDGGFGFEEGLLFRGNLNFEYQLNASTTLSAGGRFYVPTMNDARDNEAMLYGGIIVKLGGKK
ncbi:MAG: hypothetical protein RJB39_326 [Candidatus Parcubacteria bacterium]